MGNAAAFVANGEATIGWLSMTNASLNGTANVTVSRNLSATDNSQLTLSTGVVGVVAMVHVGGGYVRCSVANCTFQVQAGCELLNTGTFEFDGSGTPLRVLLGGGGSRVVSTVGVVVRGNVTMRSDDEEDASFLNFGSMVAVPGTSLSFEYVQLTVGSSGILSLRNGSSLAFNSRLPPPSSRDFAVLSVLGSLLGAPNASLRVGSQAVFRGAWRADASPLPSNVGDSQFALTVESAALVSLETPSAPADLTAIALRVEPGGHIDVGGNITLGLIIVSANASIHAGDANAPLTVDSLAVLSNSSWAFEGIVTVRQWLSWQGGLLGEEASTTPFSGLSVARALIDGSGMELRNGAQLYLSQTALWKRGRILLGLPPFQFVNLTSPSFNVDLGDEASVEVQFGDGSAVGFDSVALCDGCSPGRIRNNGTLSISSGAVFSLNSVSFLNSRQGLLYVDSAGKLSVAAGVSTVQLVQAGTVELEATALVDSVPWNWTDTSAVVVHVQGAARFGAWRELWTQPGSPGTSAFSGSLTVVFEDAYDPPIGTVFAAMMSRARWRGVTVTASRLNPAKTLVVMPKASDVDTLDVQVTVSGTSPSGSGSGTGTGSGGGTGTGSGPFGTCHGDPWPRSSGRSQLYEAAYADFVLQTPRLNRSGLLAEVSAVLAVQPQQLAIVSVQISAGNASSVRLAFFPPRLGSAAQCSATEDSTTLCDLVVHRDPALRAPGLTVLPLVDSSMCTIASFFVQPCASAASGFAESCSDDPEAAAKTSNSAVVWVLAIVLLIVVVVAAAALGSLWYRRSSAASQRSTADEGFEYREMTAGPAPLPDNPISPRAEDDDRAL